MTKNSLSLFIKISFLFLISCQEKANFTLEPTHNEVELESSDVVYANIRANNFIAVWEEEFDLQPLASKVVSPFLPEVSLTARVISTPIQSKENKPAIFIFHGGAFLPGMGSYKSQEMISLCKYFASRGFVAISVEYRDVNLLTPSWIKAGYCATQDAKAALRYFSNHNEEYNIDPNAFYLAGISAGAIVALNAAFLEDGENIELRQEKLNRIFGSLDAQGEEQVIPFKVKGLINISGAAFDLDMLDNNPIGVFSIHGEMDNILPYKCGMPFTTYSKSYNNILSKAMSAVRFAPSLQKKLSQAKSFEVCGGEEIHLRLKKNNVPSKLITLNDDEHNVFFGQNGVLTAEGKELLKNALAFFQEL